MKNKVSRILLSLLVAFTVFSCSEEPVAPVEPTEDPITSMQAYSPNVFVLEITTTKYPEDPQPAPVEMFIGGTGGRISINWGDGAVEKITLASSPTRLNHQYDRVKNYGIRITGEIKNIDYFGMSYQGEVKLNNIHLSGLTGLKHLNLVIVGGSLPAINLSHNKLIETLDLIDLGNLSDIIIPTTNNLNDIRIMGTPQITTAVIDRVIDRVYGSVVSNPRAGSFALKAEWIQDESSDEMVGPPSDYSITKLNKLKMNYGWGISPDIDNN